jgi:alkanesulfonate monooxygenase
VTFRPVIAPTDAEAWEKAYDYASRVGENAKAFSAQFGGAMKRAMLVPESEGGKRAQRYAKTAERYDRALWTGFTRAGAAGGASTALVGGPETVAAAILDDVDAGASVVSIRGYDTLRDAIDYGKHVLPLVRQKLSHRKATGQRGSLQAAHRGYLDPSFVEAADAAASHHEPREVSASV